MRKSANCQPAIVGAGCWLAGMGIFALLNELLEAQFSWRSFVRSPDSSLRS